MILILPHTDTKSALKRDTTVKFRKKLSQLGGGNFHSIVSYNPADNEDYLWLKGVIFMKV